MNRLVQSFFLILYPFFPLWVWAFHFVTDKPLAMFLNVLLLPVAINFLGNSRARMPKYLVYLIFFAAYHIISSLIFKTIPPGTNKIFYILSDYRVFACTLFIVIENTRFDDRFIAKMNRNIYWIVILSMLVSLVQIKDPTFFFNESAMSEKEILGGMDSEIRNASIYSWYSINSGGITFPILISILLNFHDTRKTSFMIIVLAGISVAFLSRGRYIMLSALIVFSQLFFTRMKSFSKLVSLTILFAGGLLILVLVADQIGFDIQKVISARILEGGGEMESAKARVKSYEVFVKKFPENPWFGVGPETKPDVIELLGGGIPLIHVGYLSYLYFYGIAGCLILFLGLYFLLKNSWRVGKSYGFWGSFYGLLAFCSANTTFVYFNLAEMGIVLAVIYMRYYNSTHAESASG